jgi:hypothetical protein
MALPDIESPAALPTAAVLEVLSLSQLVILNRGVGTWRLRFDAADTSSLRAEMNASDHQQSVPIRAPIWSAVPEYRRRAPQLGRYGVLLNFSDRGFSESPPRRPRRRDERT